LLAGALVVAGCTNKNEGPGGDEPVAGGEMVVLLDSAFSGSWPTGLDPATNGTGGANLTQNLSIFGGLFRLVADDDGSNAKVVGHQVDSWEFADAGATLKIKLKQGIKFSDGTPFDADAVVFNLRRDWASTCFCRPAWVLKSQDDDPATPPSAAEAEAGIFAEGDDTVVIEFANPNAVAVASFVVSNANWIASPTALEAMGEEDFRVKPVGAGPFTVVSNELSTELVLQKNPNYFVEGRPYLDKLTIRSIGGDQPAYQALLAGDADAYEGMTTIPLLETAKRNSELVVTAQPATSPYVIQLNTRIPPFNDKKVREAIYYATNVDAIRQGLFKGEYPQSQTFTAPGGLFHHETIPGYRTYDLNKAKQLVAEINAERAARGEGKLTVDLGTLAAYVADQVNTALKTQWEAADIPTNIHSEQLNGLIQNFFGGQWQAMLQTAGAWDPAIGVGVGFRFLSTAPFSGVGDTKIDDLLQQAAESSDPAERDRLYLETGQLISDEAYAPYILAFAPASVAKVGVHGPGLDTKIPPTAVNVQILWDEVWKAAAE
jgi:peptide/nickel transport system substrate-binding protein